MIYYMDENLQRRFQEEKAPVYMDQPSQSAAVPRGVSAMQKALSYYLGDYGRQRLCEARVSDSPGHEESFERRDREIAHDCVDYMENLWDTQCRIQFRGCVMCEANRARLEVV